MKLREATSRVTLADIFLFSLLLALSVTSLFFVRDVLPHGRDVIIEVQGRQLYSLSLEQETVKEVTGPQGITVVEIKDGKVRVSESACQNKICMKQGWVDHGIIVCLPNRVVVRVGTKARDNRKIDAITG